MSFFKDLALGISSYPKAIRFLQKHRLLKFFLIPLALNFILFYLGISLTSYLSEWSLEAINLAWKPEEWEFWGAEFLSSGLGLVIWIVLKLFFFLIFAFFGGYLVLILLSPMLAYLSEKTEQILKGNQSRFSWIQFLKDIIRGILLAIRNLIIELFLVVMFFALSFVPILGFITGPAIFLVSSYFYGFSFMDYTSERRKLKLSESVHFVRKNKGLAIANGSIFSLVLLIPIIGVSLSGFIAVISCVAATLSILEKDLPKV